MSQRRREGAKTVKTETYYVDADGKKSPDRGVRKKETMVTTTVCETRRSGSISRRVIARRSKSPSRRVMYETKGYEEEKIRSRSPTRRQVVCEETRIIEDRRSRSPTRRVNKE